jgi:WD40 repeat protein
MDCIAFAPDGEHALTGGGEGSLYLWELRTGKRVREYEGHRGRVRAIAFSQDGTKVLSGSDDGTLMFWDFQTAKPLQTMRPARPPRSVAISPDNKWALSGGDFVDQSSGETATPVQVWNLSTGKLLRELQAHSGGVTCVAFSPTGALALTAGWEGGLKLWNVPQWKEYKVLTWSDPEQPSAWPLYTDKNAVFGSVFTPDGRYVLSGRQGGLVLWEVTSGKAALTFEGNPRNIKHVSLLQGGKQALTATQDGDVMLWDLRTGDEILTFFGGLRRGLPVNDLAFLPDGEHLVAGCEEAVTVWHIPSGMPVRTLSAFRFTPPCVTADGKYIVAANPFAYWDLAKVTPVWISTEKYWPAVVSPDGHWIIAGRYDNNSGTQNAIDIWDAKTGRKTRTINAGDNGPFHSFAISQDNNYLFAKCWVGRVALWDLQSGKLIWEADDPVPPHRPPSTSGTVAFSGDGKTVISRHFVIRTWTAVTGKLLKTEDKLPEAVGYFDSTSDYELCVSRLDDSVYRRLSVWDTKSNAFVRWLGPSKGPPRQVRKIAFSSDNKTIAVGGDSQLLRVWDINNGTLIKDLMQPARH